MASQAVDKQPAQPRGLLVIYSALMLRELLGDDADRYLVTAKPTVTSSTTKS